MADPKQPDPQVPEIKMTSTKKEMLAAYNQVVRQLREKREAQVKPEGAGRRTPDCRPRSTSRTARCRTSR